MVGAGHWQISVQTETADTSLNAYRPPWRWTKDHIEESQKYDPQPADRVSDMDNCIQG